MSAADRIWTVGHSSRTLDELVALLRQHDVQRLIDIRTVPRSRRFPHFDRETLEARLPRRRIAYRHRKDLGGRREASPDSPNTALDAGLRAYADFMASDRFRTRLASLESEARASRAALLCAEADPWRCHRSLLADALVARGWDVLHIRDGDQLLTHALHAHARLVDGIPTYPGLV